MENYSNTESDLIWDSLDLELADEATDSQLMTVDLFNPYESSELFTEQLSPIPPLEFGDLESLMQSSIGMDVVGETLGLFDQQCLPSKNQRCESIDSPYLSLELQDSLVQLFMTSVHILCPAVNTAEFCRWYKTRYQISDEGSLKVLVLQAILFVTFPHLNDQQIRNAGLGSMQKAQKVLFEHTLGLYQTAVLTNEGHLALTQTALLLSHWSPYNNSREVNSFWIDEAFRHAILGHLYKSTDCHDRRTWWCCVVRNRVLALALCRPNKLRLIEPGRLPDVSVCEPAPVFSQSNCNESQGIDQIFVALCKLSTVMSEILALRNSVSCLTGASSPRETQKLDKERLERLVDLELQLQNWAEDYENTLSNINQESLPRLSRVQIYIPRIIYTSTRASLYEAFISSLDSSRPISWLLRRFSLSRVKEVSNDVAAQAGELLKFAKTEDIPLVLPAWLILPVAVHLVRMNSELSADYTSIDIQRFGNLMRLLHAMSSRFEGVQFVTKVVQNIIDALNNSKQGGIGGGEEFTRLQRLKTRIDKSERAQTVATSLLTTVADIIRSGLAHEDLLAAAKRTRP